MRYAYSGRVPFDYAQGNGPFLSTHIRSLKTSDSLGSTNAHHKLLAQGVYQMGDVYARSCVVMGTSLETFTPKRLAS